MDEYYLSREDLDTIMEVGVGERREAVVTKEISTATKTALTKKCVSFLIGVPAASVTDVWICTCMTGSIGTMQESIRYLSTRLRIWVKYQRNFRAVLHLILKRPSMYVSHSLID